MHRPSPDGPGVDGGVATAGTTREARARTTLGIASLGVTLTYDRPPGAPQTLQEMDVRTGPLRLRILR